MPPRILVAVGARRSRFCLLRVFFTHSYNKYSLSSYVPGAVLYKGRRRETLEELIVKL